VLSFLLILSLISSSSFFNFSFDRLLTSSLTHYLGFVITIWGQFINHKTKPKGIFLEYSYNAMKGQNPKRTKNMNTRKNILRFTVSMDKDLLEELLRLTGQKRKSRAVNIACGEFVRIRQKEV